MEKHFGDFMLNFKKLYNSDKAVLNEYVKLTDTIGSDYCCGSWFSWYDFDAMTWAKDDIAVYIRADLNQEPVFLSPLTTNENYPLAVDRIYEYCQENNVDFKIVFATKPQIEKITKYKLSTDIANSEYIYSPSDLINLEGKKYHAKRNHIHKFTSSYKYIFRDYTEDDYDGVVALMNHWGENREKVSFEEEKNALLLMLKTCFEASRIVDVVEIDGKIVGVSVGEITPTNVGVVLFEKAAIEYEGLYTAINQMFAEKHFKNVRYINRQEDMAIEGLRKSKQSYFPVMLLDKYTITESDDVQLEQIYRECFDDSDSFIRFFMEEIRPTAQVVTIENDGTIVSAVYLIKKQFELLGKTVSTAFLTAVATRQAYRNKGYMTKLLDKTLTELYENGMIMALLCPFKPDFYTKYGFCTIDHRTNEAIKHISNEYTIWQTQSPEDLLLAYNNFTKGMSYKIVKSQEDFQNKLAEISVDGGQAFVVLKDEKPCGYFMYIDDNIEEGAYTKKMLECAEFLDGKQVYVSSFKGEGFAQARILNIDRFVELFDFDKNNLPCNIYDDIIEANDVFVKNAEDASTVHAMTINEFTEKVFDFANSNMQKKGFIVDSY